MPDSVTIIPAKTAARAPKPPARSDRTDRYMQRVREHLEGLAPHERLPFLTSQRTLWIARSERFDEAVTRGTYDDVPDAPTAWDYALTIAALNEAIGKERAAPEVAVEPGQRPFTELVKTIRDAVRR